MTKAATRERAGRGSPVRGPGKDLKKPWREFLRAHKLNESRTRETVVDVFLQVSEHVDLQRLYELARRANPGVGFATVYRTMKLLEEAGLAHVRHFGDQKGALYEVAAGRSHHDHLICERCGDIVEFVSDKVERLQEHIAQEHGFTLSRHRHELYGTCPRCATRRQPAR